MALDWIPCPELGVADAECASLEVALDRDDPAAGAQVLALARLPARSSPVRGQLWFVDGGPGDSGRYDLPALDGLRELVPDLDLVTFDHRGVGASGRLSCPAQEAPDSFDGREVVGEEWPACIAHLAATEAGRLPHLTVTAAAADLVELSDRVGAPGQQVFWWGVSYGTFLVERALHLAPERPTGVLLDGLVPADWTFAEFDAGLDATSRAWLARCEATPACRERFDAPPAEVAARVLEHLDPRCRRLGLDADLVRRLTGALHLPGERYATLVPSVWVRLDRCRASDRRALVHLFRRLFPEEGGGRFEEKVGHSPVLQRHVAYAELWDPGAPPAEALAAALEGTLSTTGVSASFAEHASDWPVVPPRDPAWGRWPVTSAPILALHGGYDPTMPMDRVAGFATWLTGPHQRLVRVPLAEHVTINRGACPASISAQFLRDPRAELDTSCLAEMPDYDWDGDPAFNREVWGVADRWGAR